MRAWLGRGTWDAPSRDISHGHLGRASSFAKATEDKDARPSRAIVQPSHIQGIAADVPRRLIATEARPPHHLFCEPFE